jgi:MFS family permease
MLGATLMLALSRTIILFVISRMLQGLAGAIVWSAGLALLLDTFGHARFGKMMAYAIICQTSALTVAPVVGGFLFAKLGYHAVMTVSFVLVAIDILLRLLMIENSTRSLGNGSETASKRDSGIPSPVITPILEDPFPVDDRTPLLSTPESSSQSFLSSWYTFIIIATCPRVLASLLCFASIWALQTSFDAVLPYKVRDLFSWSSTGSGLIFLPIVLPAFFAPVGDNFYARWGARKVTAALFLSGIPSFACLVFVRHDDVLNKVLLGVFLFLSGISPSALAPEILH